MTRPLLVLALALACLLAAGLTIAGSPLDLAFFAGSFAIFTAPGWPLARWFLGSRDRFARVPFAILLGYAVGLTIYLALRVTVGTRPLLVLVSCMLVAAALEWGLTRDLPGVMRVASLTRA